MNAINLFKFLEKEKGKPIPLHLKLIYSIPLTKEELKIEGNLNLARTEITSLPQGLEVEGDVLLQYSSISSLPDNLYVGKGLYIGGTPITSLPRNLVVEKSLNMINTKISSLPSDLYVGWDIFISGTPLARKGSGEIRDMLSFPGRINGGIYK